MGGVPERSRDIGCILRSLFRARRINLIKRKEVNNNENYNKDSKYTLNNFVSI